MNRNVLPVTMHDRIIKRQGDVNAAHFDAAHFDSAQCAGKKRRNRRSVVFKISRREFKKLDGAYRVLFNLYRLNKGSKKLKNAYQWLSIVRETALFNERERLKGKKLFARLIDRLIYERLT